MNKGLKWFEILKEGGIKMKMVTLFVEEDLQIDLDDIVNGLNESCKYIKFKKGHSRCSLSNKPISHPESFKNLSKELQNEIKNDFFVMLYTSKPYYNNYFFESFGKLIIFSLYGWDYLTKLSMNNGIVFSIADYLALSIDDSYRHNETTGCIYDFLWDKTGIDISIRSSFICSRCLTRLSNKKYPTEKVEILADLKNILNNLGLASKWNQDIAVYWSEYMNTMQQNKSLDTKVGIFNSQDFMPDGEDNNELNLNRSHIKNLCETYFKLTDPGINNHEKGKVFEDFTEYFLGLIRGWKVIGRNRNLGDCEIDITYNIANGPIRLKEKLGDVIYIECKNRNGKSEARDISHFIMNLRTRRLKGGIFFSLAGISGYNPADWGNLDAGYQRILNACRQDELFVLPLVGQDIEAVKNGKNIIHLLEELIDRFYMI